MISKITKIILQISPDRSPLLPRPLLQDKGAIGDGGNVVGTENLMVDGAGMYDLAASNMLCPFGAADSKFTPPFCNIVQTGSKFDLVVGSVCTDANNRVVGSNASGPVVPGTITSMSSHTALPKDRFLQWDRQWHI